MVTLEDLVQQLVERGGSDLHLAAGSAPMIRINGRLVATDCEILDSESVKKVIYSILDNEQMSHGRNPFTGERLILASFGA